MKLAIFGANGPVGLLLTQQALDERHTVRAVTRRPGAFPIEAEGLEVFAGDVFDRERTAEAIAGCDAVISTLGVPYTLKPVSVYSVGITHIIAGMREAGIRRLVAVTSGGTNPERDLSEGLFWSLVLKPIIGRTLYADMRRMEQIVSASGLDWTIARPARLVDTATVTAYQRAESYLVPGLTTTSRRDLADFLLRQVSSDADVGKALAIGTAV